MSTAVVSFYAMVEQLMERGFSREKAEAAARKEHHITPGIDLVDRRANALEKQEQNAIRKMALAIGMKVYNLSQARASKQTPGLPDLWLTHERFAGWFEVKRSHGGRASTAQLAFADECRAAKIAYGIGDRHDFAKWLDAHGFVSPSIPMD